MAWDPSRDPGWAYLQSPHPMPLDNAMANLALHPNPFGLQAPMGQLNWQGANNANPNFNPNMMNPQVHFPPLGATPHLASNRPIIQNVAMTTGISNESPAVAFSPGSTPPIIDPVTFVGPTTHGVIKIKNIPYGITMAEVQQFVLKHVAATDILQPHRDGYPYHIIMERSTGKTMDVFIEVQSQDTAAEAVDRNFRGMKFNRLGQRMVNLELSSQAQLLRDLFPRARSIVWDEENNGAPYLVENTDPYSSGFNGFMTSEELNGLIRHAETPSRSPFAQRSQQRPYESMISTLYKFPWYAADLYTMKERDAIYSCFMRQLKALVEKVDPLKERREVGLDTKLLMEFVFAGMNCPGFSQRMKFSIVTMSAGLGRGVILNAHARFWPFQCLGPDPTKVSDQDIGMWLHIIQSGIEAMIRKQQGIHNIGIEPHLGVEFVDDCFVVRGTDSGMHLTHQGFAALEEKFLAQVLKKGWAVYLGQYGLVAEELSTLGDPFDDGNSLPATDPTSSRDDINGPGPAVATDGRISTARVNPAAELSHQTHIPSAPLTQPKLTIPWAKAPPFRPRNALPIVRPDGGKVKAQHSETAVIAEGVGEKYAGSISNAGDESTSRSPERRLGRDSDQLRFPSDASSNYNFPVISRTSGSPMRGAPSKPLSVSATVPNTLTPARSLRRVSGTSVSPTKVDRSVASFRTVGSPRRKSSLDKPLGESGFYDPQTSGIGYYASSACHTPIFNAEPSSSPARQVSGNSSGTFIGNSTFTNYPFTRIGLSSTGSTGTVAEATGVVAHSQYLPREGSIAEEKESGTNIRSSSSGSSNTVVHDPQCSSCGVASASTTGLAIRNTSSLGEEANAEEKEESGTDPRSVSISSSGTVIHHDTTFAAEEDDTAEEEELGYSRYSVYSGSPRKGA